MNHIILNLIVPPPRTTLYPYTTLFRSDEAERAVVYYVALLAWIGCHADSHEQAAWFGDDIVLRADRHETDLVGLPASWSRVIACAPALAAPLADGEVDTSLEAAGDLADLKSPYMTGHSRGVAQLAAPAAATLGYAEHQVVVVRRAALMHDMGRLGI